MLHHSSAVSGASGSGFAEDSPEYVVLNRVGVLELVDECRFVVAPKFESERVAAGTRKCLVQACQQVVVGKHLELHFARPQLSPGEDQEVPLQGHRVVRFLPDDLLADVEKWMGRWRKRMFPSA